MRERRREYTVGYLFSCLVGGGAVFSSPLLWDLSTLVLDSPSPDPEDASIDDWSGLAADVDDVAFVADWDTWGSASLALDGEILILESVTVALEVVTFVLESVKGVVDWVSVEALVCVVVASLLLDCVRRDLELVIWAIWDSRAREEDESLS